MDPALVLAAERAIELQGEIIAELTATKGHRPIVAMLNRAKEEAAEAIAALAEVDPEIPGNIRYLQNRVTIYRDLIRWLKDMVHEGYDAGRALDESGGDYMAFLDLEERDMQTLRDIGAIKEEPRDL